MCDDVARIMAMVRKVKEVEQKLKREITVDEYGVILWAYHEQKFFTIEDLEFGPPIVTRGLKAHQEEMEYAID